MTQRTWSGATDSFSNAAQWSPNGVPTSGDTAIINSGTVTATALAFANVGINLNGSASAVGTLILNGDTFDSASVLTVTDNANFGATTTPTLTFQGTVTNAGTIDFAGTTPSVTFASGASLINAGTIVLAGSSPQIQTGTTTPGAITNNGSIQVTNPSNAYQSAIVNATITGTGTIGIGNNGAISFRQSIGSGQTLAFSNSSTANSSVELDTPGSFSATVSGFVQSDRLILTNIPYSSYSYTSTGTSSGTLTLFSGSTAESQINLSGTYGFKDFTVAANPLGTSGLYNVTVSTGVTNSTTGAGSLGGGSGSSTSNTSSSTSSSTGAVYRFFDKTYGTHFFTADVGERNNLINNLSASYTEETNGFGDVSSSDSNATAVYRFFDTKYGTHFFTASSSERDTILSTRPDLTYEPSSTFYEHATQQSGDVAVYRFFDTQYGTHFYTGDAGEFAGLTTPGSASYRSNLTYEGVGFYAPNGSYA